MLLQSATFLITSSILDSHFSPLRKREVFRIASGEHSDVFHTLFSMIQEPPRLRCSNRCMLDATTRAPHWPSTLRTCVRARAMAAAASVDAAVAAARPLLPPAARLVYLCRRQLPPAEHTPPTRLPQTAAHRMPAARPPAASTLAPRRIRAARCTRARQSIRAALGRAVPAAHALQRAVGSPAAHDAPLLEKAFQPVRMRPAPPGRGARARRAMRATLQRSCAAPAANMRLTRHLAPLAQALQRRHRDRSQRPQLGLRAPAWPLRTQRRASCQPIWPAIAPRARRSCRRAAGRRGVQSGCRARL